MSDAELQQAIAAREKQVSSLLSNPSGAVKAALAEPPYAATNMETKKLSAKVVVKALCAVPDKEVGTVVDSLTGDERDVLMKYLYRGLEEAEACSQLLRWHGVLADKAGSGCIMRALSESTRLCSRERLCDFMRQARENVPEQPVRQSAGDGRGLR